MAIGKQRLDTLLAEADVLIVCTPLTPATKELIGARELSLMKPAAILVNVARGAIVDEAALFAHLQVNPDFTAGIDTWWDEPRGGAPFHTFLERIGADTTAKYVWFQFAEGYSTTIDMPTVLRKRSNRALPRATAWSRASLGGSGTQVRKVFASASTNANNACWPIRKL